MEKDDDGRMSEEEVRAALAGLRQRIDAGLANMRQTLDAERHAAVSSDSDLTPDAVPAIFALIRKLPGIITGSLSGDVTRVAEANGTMTDLQWRLRDAGVTVDERFGRFPERLAGLRRGFEQARRGRRQD